MSTLKQQIIARLTEGTCRMSELRELTGKSYMHIASTISKLRKEGWAIGVMSTETSRDQRYIMNMGPDSINMGLYLCPNKLCHRTIRVGCPEDHHPDCAFGPRVVEELRSHHG